MNIRKNKKGAMGFLGIAMGVFLVVGIIFLVTQMTGFGTPREQALLQNEGTSCTADADCGNAGLACINSVCKVKDISGVKAGKAATLTLAAFDNAGDSRAQTGVPGGYVWLHNGEKVLVSNNVDLTATSRFSVTDVVTGSVVDAVAFATSTTDGFYGQIKRDVTVDIESKPVDLEVWNLTNGALDFDIFDEDDNLVVSNSASNPANVTISGTGGDSHKLSRIRVTNNQTNRAFNLGGLSCDTADATNITEIKFDSLTGGSISLSTQSLRRRSGDNFLFLVTPQILMLEQQEVTLNGMTFTTDGSVGNGNSAGETVTCVLADWAPYLTVNTQYGEGLEDDALSASDVGTGDTTINFNVSSAFA